MANKNNGQAAEVSLASQAPIQKVTVVGGTHGNEFTGVYLVKKWQQQPQAIQRDSFSCDTLIANPAALKANRRYTEVDLNRSFSRQTLQDKKLNSYEVQRAREIEQLLGPKGNAKVDFILDLHTTTANMGVNLILVQHDAFHVRLAAYVQQQLPGTVITSELELMDDHHFLASISRAQCLVEVGPIPQGVVRHDIFEQTETATHAVLDFIDKENRGENTELPESLTVFSYIEPLPLPKNEQGELNGMIHKHLQDQDFCLIKPGDPVFRLFDGRDVLYEGDEPLYVSFINEAAYYDKLMGFWTLRKVDLPVPQQCSIKTADHPS